MPPLYLTDCDAWSPDVFEETLSAAERTRAGRYRRSLDRDRFFVRRGLLRRLLGAWTARDPAEVTVHAGPHGKPYLGRGVASAIPRTVTWPAFNLSRSGGIVLYAIEATPANASTNPAFSAADSSIGVDIERIDDDRHTLDDLLRIASRFAPQERRWLEVIPRAEAAAVFHRLWTCKEACLKCLGTGIGGAGPGLVDIVRIAEGDGDGIEIWSGGDGLEWIVHPFEPCAGHVAAVARPAGQRCDCLFPDPIRLEPDAAERRTGR